ncbi:MAG: hypothetical protein ABSE40_06560 [Candidatus Sulfotelmatobacter sp.]|jgi:hypothetical protein
MGQVADGTASTVEQLNERVQELERRVSELEGLASSSTYPRLTGTEIQEPRVRAPKRALSLLDASGGAVPILGKAVLGIAGAYLLRAIAETGTIPKLPVLLVAIVYAALWMVWAARMHVTSRFASATYALTSALILSPLLWESTVRFQVLSPAFAAGVLVAFVVLALALAWQQNMQSIPWVAVLAAVGTCLALIIGTHELVPLTAALLAVALATEVAVCLGHRLTLRALSALAADFAVWLAVFVLTSSEGVPEAYHSVSPATTTGLCLSLLAIYGGSIGVRSFGLRQRITFVEIGQGVIAFVLAAYGSMRATRGSAAAQLGVLFLLLAAACYWGALSRFTEEAYTRNRRVSATWAAALLLTGSFLLFPANFQVPILCLMAAAAAFVYTRTRKLSLGLHASFYLVAAAAVSALPAYAASALAGSVPRAPGWTVWIVVISAVVCYAAGSWGGKDQGKRQLLWVVPAALVGFAGAALAVAALVWLFASRVQANASRLSVVRTIVNCALALALGFFGSRWKRVELGWVAYAAVVFGTLKLLFEDLRFGNAASLVVSLLFYGLVLILLPRLMRRGQAGS